jgi:hypothetical protein
MKRTIISIAALTVLGLSGCSTTTPKTNPLERSSEYNTPLKDTALSVDFTDQGVKIFYTSSGKLEKIEVYGTAPVWKGNVDVLSEADAMSKLVKFVHGQNVTSDRTVKILGKAIENSQDNMANSFKSRNGKLGLPGANLNKSAGNNESGSADDLMAVDADDSNQQMDEKNSDVLRKASVVNQTIVNTVNTITSRGHLSGVRKVRDSVKDDGKLYVAVYQWSEQDQATSDMMRNVMSRRMSGQ